MLYHRVTGTHGERGPLLKSSYMTRVLQLHTAGISDVDSVMFTNRIRKMVNFELGKEIEKYVFRSSCHELIKTKKNVSPHEESNLTHLSSS